MRADTECSPTKQVKIRNQVVNPNGAEVHITSQKEKTKQSQARVKKKNKSKKNLTDTDNRQNVTKTTGREG